MGKLDVAYALTGKNRDPFFVPDKQAEIISFVAASMLVGLLAFASFTMTANVTNITILAAIGLFAVSHLVRGIRQRRYRLTRAAEVEDLHRKLAAPLPPQV